MTTPYTTGQISLVNGSAMVTGVGTGWATSLIIGGTIYVEADGGNALPILEIGSDTAITAAIAWTGPTGTYDYALVRDTAYGQQTVANAQALADYIQRLNNTALAAISGVNPASEMVLMFTGPDTATVVPRSAFIQGGEYDVQVNNLAARSAYDSKPGPTSTNRGFAVLVSNIGDGRAAIYSKLSDTAGDWSQPGPLTGAKGDSGPFTEITVGPTTTLPYGSQATVTVVLVDADTIRLDFGIPAGQDGTGTGDFVGPSSSADNELVLFSGPSGKQGKRGPLLSSLGNSQNEAILALEVADLKGSRLGMKGGVADAFDDETGVDVKTNAVYDATNDWYTPSVVVAGTSYSNPGGTGNRSSSITVTSSGFTFAAGNVGLLVNGLTADNTLYFSPANQTGYIQFDFGAGNAKYIDQFSFYQVASYAGPGPWSWSGSNDGVNFTTILASFSLASGNPAVIDTPGQTVAYRYFRISASNVGVGGGYLNEITFRISSSPSYANPGGTGNRTSLITVTSTLTASNANSPSAVVDGSDTGSYGWTAQAVAGKYLRFDFGSGNQKYIAEMKWRQGVTQTQGVFRWQGSNDGSTWANIGDEFTLNAGAVAVGSLFESLSTESGKATSTYRFLQLLGVSGNSVDTFIREIEFKIDSSIPSTATTNMTLVSVAYPLASVPTTARMTLQTVEFDAATPNTDFVAEFSRDGGTTWTAANLTLSPYLVVGNYKMYEAQPFSVTGQPSGSSMKWRARTLTNKNIAMSGIVSQGN